MIRIIGTKGSGKTTKLLNIAAENGYVLVEPNLRMADLVRRMAFENRLNVNVISAHELLYRRREIACEKYLVDELEMFMTSLGIVGYSDELEAQDKLLKEQEAIKPYLDYDGRNVWRCGKCGNTLFHLSYYESDEDEKNHIRYCSHCGSAVKWDKEIKSEGGQFADTQTMQPAT